MSVQYLVMMRRPFWWGVPLLPGDLPGPALLPGCFSDASGAVVSPSPAAAAGSAGTAGAACGAASLMLTATAPGGWPGMAPALLMAVTAAAVAAPKGGSGAAVGTRSGGAVAAA
jgi:hypothetical protein